MLQMQGQKPLTFQELAAAIDRELSDNKSELFNGLLETPETKDSPEGRNDYNRAKGWTWLDAHAVLTM